MEILLYTLSVMYSPGPVNFIGLNSGLTGKLKQSIGFFIGVGCAMLFLFLALGYVGEAIIPHHRLYYISLFGAIYTFFIAYKMLTSDLDNTDKKAQKLTFFNGFFIQLLNPKGILVILPVTTIMYPAAKITGVMILMISFFISIGAAGAPFVYALAGKFLGVKISQPKWFNCLNKIMALMLIFVGAGMVKDFIVGINLI
ncbi:LysE family translocator [Acinetobacter bereziniae]|uniref:LysE family translocator n=1 Tax=Acinetobacter bereziniae TaxID=106648 RepID=UPI003009AE4A